MNRSKITKFTVDIPSSIRPLSVTRASPSRWSTAEFRFYYLVFMFAIPLMVWLPIPLSMPSHSNYQSFRDRLTPGWMFGRPIDNSDAQYSLFRNNIPLLTLAAIAQLSAKFLWTRLTPKPSTDLIPFNIIFSIFAIIGLHGANIIKIGVILGLNYAIAKQFCRSGTASKLGPILTWTFNAAALFGSEIYQGCPFSSLSKHLAFLDSFQGVYPGWHVTFNITMLRLISFNMDYYWSRDPHEESKGNNERLSTEKERQSVPHPAETYSFGNYLAYVLYTPLYIGGPIMTFNDFMWQQRRPLTITGSAIRSYALRFAICLLTMESILHFMYVVAIKDTRAWLGYTPGEISMVGFWNLIIVWLKLLIPWRFFRLWALLDGVDPPENMVRCMGNNYSTLGFWRSWHRSYNLWVIRYIYIPLGGKRNSFVNIVIVFSFVALWHDLTFRLLAWGWLIALFIVPEVVAQLLLPASKYEKQWWYRHICAVGGVVNVLMMMSANLVGFVIGLEGVRYFVHELLFTIRGVQCFAVIVFCLFVGVQVMFEYREEELRNGICRRC
ncbi:MBOAT, membrane-bound O-acyltransferase family domain containing protein [Amanita muscaria]